METGSFKPSKRNASAKRKLDDVLMPVSPSESGKGLPYAAVNWPNPGDIWGWKVGRRIRKSGFYQDRYLIAPESLQERPSRQILFESKLSVERYIRSKFPDADINAFFASFTWDIAAKAAPQRKGKFASSSKSFPSQEEKHRLERADGISRTTKSARGQKSEESTDELVIELKLDVSSVEEGTLADGTTTKVLGKSVFKDGEISNSHAAASPTVGVICSPVGCKFDSLEPFKESEAELTAEEFDNYVDALDEILTLALPRDQASWKREEMIEAREKLSSLLAMDFPSLVSSDKLNELADYASKLQNDPSLSPRELSMIKLIQEIPLMRKCFLEAKETSNEADKFFADLDSNIASAASLKKEYNKSKEEIEVLQAEEASTLLAMLETDDQIAALQSYRLSLTQAIKVTNKKIVQCTSSQKRVMDCLPKIVHEVQAANSRKAEWELRKKKSAKEEAEILAKFAPLKGFPF